MEKLIDELRNDLTIAVEVWEITFRHNDPIAEQPTPTDVVKILNGVITRLNEALNPLQGEHH